MLGRITRIGLYTAVVSALAAHAEPAASRYSVSATPQAGTAGMPVISLKITDTISATSQQLDVQGASGEEVEAFVLPDGSRAVITERVKYGKAATLVDLRTSQIIDRILGYGLSLSPDGTKAVYIYHYPPHGSFDDVVVSYDFRLSPAENASPGWRPDCPGGPSCPSPDQQYQRGVVVYPTANRHAQEFLTQSAPRLAVISPFTWCGASVVGFLEGRGPLVTLVTLSVQEDLRKSSVLTRTDIDRKRFLEPQYGDKIPPEFRDALPVAERLAFLDLACRSLEIVPHKMGPFGRPVTVSVPSAAK
jgi:hypothetical protein